METSLKTMYLALLPRNNHCWLKYSTFLSLPKVVNDQHGGRMKTKQSPEGMKLESQPHLHWNWSRLPRHFVSTQKHSFLEIQYMAQYIESYFRNNEKSIDP